MSLITPTTDPAAKKDVARVQQISSVQSILNVVCQITGMRFAAVARVTEDRWIACATKDLISFGLEPGGELKIETTICNEIRQNREAVVFNDAATDAVYCMHHTPKIYGIKSYISMPIIRSDGSFFGTLCAIDPDVQTPDREEVVSTFKLFAELISHQLDVVEKLEQKEHELKAKEKDGKLREEFIAVLGHDLRNPLSTVSTGIALLQNRNPRPEQTAVLTLMQNATKRMTRLIDDVLDYARGRLNGGIQLARTEAFNLAAELSGVIDGTSLSHQQHEIKKDIDINQHIICDVPRLTQLLSNLLNNALAYGAPGHPIHVNATDDGGAFTLSVTNGGKPIPQDRQAHLFKPFTKDNSKGLGLGLYICSEIAKSHGGTIQVASNDEKTTFIFRMPIKR